MHSTSYADVTPVSDRTSQVRDAIVAAVPNIDAAADVTETHLATITSLNLRGAGISVLKTGDFSGLTGLTNLNLYNNDLSSLPDGIFEGLTALTTLRLGGNTVNPLPITVSIENLDNGQFKVVVPTGAPFDIVLPLSAMNGSIGGEAASITISKGSTESSALTASRTAGMTAAVTADIGTLPGLPQNHYGYTLSKSSALPVEIISEVVTTTPIVPEPIVPEPIEPEPIEPEPIEPEPIEPEPSTNTAPVFTDGVNIIRTIAENTAANINIGSAVSATDADDDTLTYSLSGTDAAAFEIDSSSGQLKTKTTLDYEMKRIYILIITVSDGNLTDAITVVISVMDVAETTLVSTTLAVSDRTPAVRDAIVAAVPNITAAEDVTATHLSAITALNLRSMGITALQSGDFAGLTGLTNLNLYGNMLTSLPSGIFEGLTSLTTLRLGRNLVDPMLLIVSLQQVAAGQFKAVISEGAPFDMTIPINGSTVTISKGSTESATFTSTTNVSIGALPSLPANHFGYVLVQSAICNRTSQVAEAIAAAVPNVTDCNNVTEVDLARITSLNLSSMSITSLASGDFDGLTALTKLWLSVNSISDISPLAELTSLTTLSLRNNSISDISPLQELTNLTELLLSSNRISDISPLQELTNLTELLLSSNSISDISTLENLTNLTELDLSSNSISDISPLQELTALTMLVLSVNSISDISTLEELTALTQLSLRNNSIINISTLAELTNLTTLSLSSNRIRDISALENLTNLTQLILSSNRISDISPLAELTNLTTLSLSVNHIRDISALEELTSLARLYMASNRISDISALEELTSLETLDFYSNGISDISALEELTSLTKLYLSRNSISDISTLEELTSLETLDLSRNDISDISTLEELTALTTLRLSGNPISDYAPLRRMQANNPDLTIDIEIPAEDRNAAPASQTLPTTTALLSNYPNPFNPETWIPYHLANPSNVQITIYDARGTVVQRLELGHQRAGIYTSRSRAAYWNGKNNVGEKVASGLYFYQLQGDNMSLLHKMVILK